MGLHEVADMPIVAHVTPSPMSPCGDGMRVNMTMTIETKKAEAATTLANMTDDYLSHVGAGRESKLARGRILAHAAIGNVVYLATTAKADRNEDDMPSVASALGKFADHLAPTLERYGILDFSKQDAQKLRKFADVTDILAPTLTEAFLNMLTEAGTRNVPAKVLADSPAEVVATFVTMEAADIRPTAPAVGEAFGTGGPDTDTDDTESDGEANGSEDGLGEDGGETTTKWSDILTVVEAYGRSVRRGEAKRPSDAQKLALANAITEATATK